MYHSKWAWIVSKALFVEISLCIKVCVVLYLKAFRPSWETPPGPHSACWLLMKTPYYRIIRRRHRWEDCEVSLGRAAIDYWEHCVVCSQDSAQSYHGDRHRYPEHSTSRRQSTETGDNTILLLSRYVQGGPKKSGISKIIVFIQYLCDFFSYYWALLGPTRPYWALLGSTGPYWTLLGLTGPYLDSFLHLMTD